MDGSKQSRKWQYTINNPVQHGYTHDNLKKILSSKKNIVYWCLCDEIGGETQTYHTHIYVHFKSAVRFSTIKKLIPIAHIECARGTALDNRNYIRKEGKYKNSEKETTNLKDTFEEFGDCPVEEQGKRNDLEVLYDMIKDGLSDYEILESNSDYILQLDKIARVRKTVLEQKYRNVFRDNLTVTYVFGATGTGKTRDIFGEYGYEKVYRVTDYSHPFDSYEQQPVIVFEEFRNSLKIQDMLNYLDKYPVLLPCRYVNKVACYVKVYIVSNWTLEQQYMSIQEDYKETWLAFLRRIDDVKEYKKNGTIIAYNTICEYFDRLVPVLDDTPVFNDNINLSFIQG